MSYETKLYIVEKHDNKLLFDDGIVPCRYCGDVVASFDLCRLSEDMTAAFRDYPATDCYIYVDGEQTTSDKYGEKLREIPIGDAVRILKDSSENYRRLSPCIGLLSNFDLSEWQDLVVLHYGY